MFNHTDLHLVVKTSPTPQWDVFLERMGCPLRLGSNHHPTKTLHSGKINVEVVLSMIVQCKR